jgi:glycosyltransferase involved in cell wall biosynthesis
MPTISVIIPAYNVERWVSQTIKSVQQQTFSDLEIIVIDDGSTDKTLEIIKDIRDHRLKVLSHEHAGVSVARNVGIAHSTCEFIAFLDADDLWTPDSLEPKLAGLHKYPTADVAYCWTLSIDDQGTIIQPKRPPVFYEGNIYFKLLTHCFFDCGSLLIRRRAIKSVGEFDPTLKYGEDLDYWLRLARHSSFVVIPRYQLLYRKWNGSTTYKLDPEKLEVQEENQLRVRKRAFQQAPKKFHHQRRYIANFFFRYACLHMECQPDRAGAKRACQRLRRAIRTDPKILLQYSNLKFLIVCLLARMLPHRVFDCTMHCYRRIRKGICRIFPLSYNPSKPPEEARREKPLADLYPRQLEPNP